MTTHPPGNRVELGDPREPRVEVVIKDGCHLCDEALEVVAQVCAELDTAWAPRRIEDSPELAIEYGEYLPVVLIDGQRHDFWRVDPARLRAALTQ